MKKRYIVSIGLTIAVIFATLPIFQKITGQDAAVQAASCIVDGVTPFPAVNDNNLIIGQGKVKCPQAGWHYLRVCLKRDIPLLPDQEVNCSSTFNFYLNAETWKQLSTAGCGLKGKAANYYSEVNFDGKITQSARAYRYCK